MTLRRRDMTLDDREREYSPSSCLPDGDYRPFIEAYVSRSDAAWASVLDDPTVRTTVVRYGAADSHTVDVAVPTSPAGVRPLLVFIHGGYWQELSKIESRFAARDCIDRGWGFAAVDYTLAPAATIGEIIEECRRAVATLAAAAVDLGIDPARLVVAGSSAGAHLAAEVALDSTIGSARVAGTVLVSGVYDLEPLIGTSIDGALGLDVATAAAWSPLRDHLAGFPPTVVAIGQNETDEFMAQSVAFAAALDLESPVLEIPDRNHFDVVLDLARPGTLLGEAVADLIGSSGGRDADV